MLNLKIVFEIHSSCQNENSVKTNQWSFSVTTELKIKWKKNPTCTNFFLMWEKLYDTILKYTDFQNSQ